MKIIIVALAISLAFSAGMYISQRHLKDTFHMRTGVELSKIYSALAHCEGQVGSGNCKIIGGFVPKDWQPQPQAVPQALEHSQQREL